MNLKSRDGCLKKQRGATIVEYAIKVCLISAVAIGGIKATGTKTNETFSAVFATSKSANKEASTDFGSGVLPSSPKAGDRWGGLVYHSNWRGGYWQSTSSDAQYKSGRGGKQMEDSDGKTYNYSDGKWTLEKDDSQEKDH